MPECAATALLTATKRRRRRLGAHTQVRRPWANASQRGGASIEFALLLPFLLILTLGIFEISRAFMNYNVLNRQVRIASRYISDNLTVGSTGVLFISGDVASVAKNLVIYGSPGVGGSALLPDLQPGDIVIEATGVLENVVVRASYEHEFLLGPVLDDLLALTGGEFPDIINLTASAVMRVP